MGHKREQSVKHCIGDYVMMRVYGRKKFYLAQVQSKRLRICKVNLDTNMVQWTDETKEYTIPTDNRLTGCDIVVVNYGLRRNIDIVKLEQESPELLLRLI